jgi:hypothetical protein
MHTPPRQILLFYHINLRPTVLPPAMFNKRGSLDARLLVISAAGWRGQSGMETSMRQPVDPV